MPELKYLDATGVKHLWDKILEKAHSLYGSKLDNVVAGDESISVTNNNSVSVNVSSHTGNLISINQTGLYAETPDTYRIDKTADNQYEAVYHLKRIPFGQTDGSDAGVQIVIPKDISITEGHIVEKADSGAWGSAGTYLELTTTKQEKIYIHVGSAITKETESTLNSQSDNVPTSEAVANYVNQVARYNVGNGLNYEQNTNTIRANLLNQTRLNGSATSAAEVNNRTYPVALDANGRLAVNIPWTDTTPVRSVNGKVGYVSLDKKDVGLDNVDNTSDLNKPVSNATQVALNNKLNYALKGVANGLAELDENGLVPTSQLPSFVDDVVEYSGISQFPAEGQSGKIYVDLSDNKTYRWSGTTYVEISPSIALGNTSSTAFRGDYGQIAYTHAVNKGAAYASGLYKITTNAEGHVISATPVVKQDIVNLGFDGQRTLQINGQTITADPLNIVAGNGINLSFSNGVLTISTNVIPIEDEDIEELP